MDNPNNIENTPKSNNEHEIKLDEDSSDKNQKAQTKFKLKILLFALEKTFYP